MNNVKYALVNLNTGEVLKDPETGEELVNKKAYLIDYLKSHAAFRDSYLEMLREHIAASNDRSLLNKSEMQDIEAEDQAIEKPDNSSLN